MSYNTVSRGSRGVIHLLLFSFGSILLCSTPISDLLRSPIPIPNFTNSKFTTNFFLHMQWTMAAHQLGPHQLRYLRALSSRSCAFIGFAIALAFYVIIFQHVFPTENVKNESTLPEGYDYEHLEQLQLPNSYQCALVWLRLPKTASTSVIKRFIAPLAKSANFVNADMGPNTCVTHVGGCTDLWGGYETNKSQWAGIDDHSIAPPYGASSYDNIGRSDGNNQRCFPDEIAKTKLYCWEYDQYHSTIFYGPHHSSKRRKRKKKKRKHDAPLAMYMNNSFTTAKFDLYPSLHTHVAVDTSLFGWLLPQRPMVFSTFRDPVDRLISSFHYGIQFGGGEHSCVCAVTCLSNR